MRLGEVRQRHEVAVEEGEAVVVILDVEAAAHLAPVLVDEQKSQSLLQMRMHRTRRR